MVTVLTPVLPNCIVLSEFTNAPPPIAVELITSEPINEPEPIAVLSPEIVSPAKFLANSAIGTDVNAEKPAITQPCPLSTSRCI